jgi:hypothetical protein
MLSVLFLDVDGVLNNKFTKTFRSKFFDFENVFQLDRIIQETNCKIVISSGWRLAGLNCIDEQIETACIENKDMVDRIKSAIMDRTPDYVQDSLVRGDEIQAWMDNNNFTGRFVIIDDVPDMAHLMDHLVLTKNHGLTKELADKAILLLSGD